MNDDDFKIGLSHLIPLIPNFNTDESKDRMEALHSAVKWMKGREFRIACARMAQDFDGRWPTPKKFKLAYRDIMHEIQQTGMSAGARPMTRGEHNLWCETHIRGGEFVHNNGCKETFSPISPSAARWILEKTQREKVAWSQNVLDALIERSAGPDSEDQGDVSKRAEGMLGGLVRPARQEAEEDVPFV